MIMKSQTTTFKLYHHEAKAENYFTLKSKFFFLEYQNTPTQESKLLSGRMNKNENFYYRKVFL